MNMEKKRKPDDVEGEGGGTKKTPGRPKILPPELDKRHQLRCASKDFDLWEEYSKTIGFPNVSAWLRKVANAALPPELRRRAAR
jgi:hypothetical protein